MKLNKAKWTEARLEVEAAIREMKSRKRESHQPRWCHGPDDWKLAALKSKAGGLYWLRNYLRKKVDKSESAKQFANHKCFDGLVIKEELLTEKCQVV
jgi:hypothetical protein